MFGLARHAAAYDRVAGRVADRLYRRIADDVAALSLPPGAAILDIGTGPGRLPRYISDRCPGATVQGVDLSDEMIAHAREAAEAAGYPSGRPAYAVADVADLPYDDDSVDLVVSSLSLHHWEDVPAGLREVARVLRPGGQAWIYDIRPVLKRVEPAARRASDAVHLERRLAGASRLNPLARLVIGPAHRGTP
jgi:ubiquinone/menaquinone biosynthesis C-methylase UbiE